MDILKVYKALQAPTSRFWPVGPATNQFQKFYRNFCSLADTFSELKFETGKTWGPTDQKRQKANALSHDELMRRATDESDLYQVSVSEVCCVAHNNCKLTSGSKLRIHLMLACCLNVRTK